MTEFAKQDRSLAQKVFDRIKKLVADIRNIYNKLIAQGSGEISALRNELETLEKIRDLFFEALDETAPAVNQEQKNTAEAVKYSFARASGKPQLTYLAEAMEQEGATKDEIWKKLGVIRDASGIWVYEIDDSDMKIYPNGDARLRNEEGYKRMNALFEKAFVNGEQISEFEQNEYSELHKKYAIQKKIAIDIGDFVVHDKLFEEYPEIAKATFGFDDLLSKGKRGYYDRTLNEIVVDNSLKKEIDKGQLGKTAIHEIQHAIQHFDDRAGGASIEFWRKKNFEKLQELQNTLADKKIERTEFFAKLDNELKVKIREVNNADDYDLKDGYTEKNILQLKLLDDDATGNYQRLLDMDYEIRKLEAEIEYQKKTDNSEVQYYDTAGEIEARETADRLKMTVDERAERMPNLGWERAVFAEGERKNYSIEQTTDNKKVVVIKDDIVKNSKNNSDLIKIVKQALGRFPEIPVHNQKIIIGKKAKKETVYSKYTQKIRKTDAQKYSDKMNLLNHPYELIYATTNYINEPLNHPRKDNIIDFARGTVLMSIGGRNYSAKVIIGYTSSGICELYDVIDFDDTVSFQIRKSDNSQAVHPKEMEFDRYELSDDNMISQNDSSVNDNSMQKDTKNTLIKLSTKPTNPIREEVSDYINNRSDMQAIYKTIDKRYRIAGKTRLNEKSIESFANKILSQTNSKYSKEQLTERLTALFEFMANRVCQFSMQIKFSSASF